MTSPRQRKKKAAILKLREKKQQQHEPAKQTVITAPVAAATVQKSLPTLAEKLAEQKPKETQKPVSVPKPKKEALRELSQTTQELGGYKAEEETVAVNPTVVDVTEEKPEEKKDEV